MISSEQKMALRATLLPDALVEERRMQKAQSAAGTLFMIGLIYTVLFHLINFFLLLPNGTRLNDWIIFVISLPGLISLTVAFFKAMGSSENSIMELTPLERELL
ncbi:MAG: hypothetical protein V4436_01570 [Patescibacteria group bacterium]